MVRIIALDKDGKEEGLERSVEEQVWKNIQKIDKHNRWKQIKTKKDGRKKRSVIGNAVEKA